MHYIFFRFYGILTTSAALQMQIVLTSVLTDLSLLSRVITLKCTARRGQIVLGNLLGNELVLHTAYLRFDTSFYSVKCISFK